MKTTYVRAFVGAAFAAAVTACSSVPPAEDEGSRSQQAALGTTESGSIVGIDGKCVDDNDDQTANGNKIQLWDCNGTDAQHWTLTASGQIQGPGGKCLDVTNGNAQSGTLVQLYDCNGTAAQQWTPQSNGSIVGLGGLCLDDQWAGTNDGNPLQVYTCNATAAQSWNWIPFVACGTTNVACGYGVPCCSGYECMENTTYGHNTGYCAPVVVTPSCSGWPAGHACESNDECCHQICENGACAQCVSNGSNCWDNAQCCNGSCSGDGTHVGSCSCTQAGGQCSLDSECCDGSCNQTDLQNRAVCN